MISEFVFVSVELHQVVLAAILSAQFAVSIPRIVATIDSFAKSDLYRFCFHRLNPGKIPIASDFRISTSRCPFSLIR